MRINRFLFITILFTFSCGCSDEQPHENERKKVSVWTGETEHINIESDLAQCNYTLESGNHKIATAILDDNLKGITIYTHNKGKTVIHLLDTDNNTRLCEIIVHAKYFESPAIVDNGFPLNNPSEVPGIIVKAADLKIQEKIENELLTEDKTLIFVTYSFNGDTQKFTAKTYEGRAYEGTYEWNLTSLILKYDDKVERYGFRFAERAARKYGHYIIQADKTEEYRLKYPDARITEVKLYHYWQDNGIR